MACIADDAASRSANSAGHRRARRIVSRQYLLVQHRARRMAGCGATRLPACRHPATNCAALHVIASHQGPRSIPVARCSLAAAPPSQRWRQAAGGSARPVAQIAAKKQSAGAEWGDGDEELGPAAQATLRMLDWGRLCSQASAARRRRKLPQILSASAAVLLHRPPATTLSANATHPTRIQTKRRHRTCRS